MVEEGPNKLVKWFEEYREEYVLEGTSGRRRQEEESDDAPPRQEMADLAARWPTRRCR